jgi:hypothetical protein
MLLKKWITTTEMSYKYSKNKLASILLASLFIGTIDAQTKNKYLNFGLNLSTDAMSTSNEANAVNYNYKKIQTFNFGLTYRIPKQKFDIVFSAIVRRFNLTDASAIKGIDCPDPNGYKSETTLYDFFQYKINGFLNKKIINSNHLDIYVGVGPEILIYPEDPISGKLLLSNVGQNEEVGYTESGNSTNKKNPFYFGINGNLGINFKTKYVLINPYFLYHFQSINLFDNVVRTQNLYVSENTVSNHSINGSYFSFGINLYPNLNILKRKVK